MNEDQKERPRTVNSALAERQTSGYSIVPQTFTELQAFCTLIANSDLAPKDYRGKAGNVLVAVQMGAECGLKPMQSVQNIAIINGRPSVYGDAALALIKQHPKFVSCREWLEAEGDQRVAHCEMIRQGEPAYHSTFSVADAKKAKLWGKAGPWSEYEERMLAMRARGFCGRNAFPDALKGLSFAEEAMDIPPEDPPVQVVAGSTRVDAVREKVAAQLERSKEPLLMDQSKTAEERAFPRTGNARKISPEQVRGIHDYAEAAGCDPGRLEAVVQDFGGWESLVPRQMDGIMVAIDGAAKSGPSTEPSLGLLPQ